MLARQAVHLVDGLDHVHRDADGACLVRDRAGDRLADPPGGIGRELVAAAVFELVHRFHQTDVALLDQVQELQAAVGVLLGDRDDQAQVGLDHFFLGIARVGLAFVHALVDVLEVTQRHHHARLQLGQLGLQLLDRRHVAGHHHGPGLVGSDLFLDPLQVEQVGREILDEGFLRHAALVYDDAAQLALFLANVKHLTAQQIAQLLNGLGGKANSHQFVAEHFLRLQVSR